MSPLVRSRSVRLVSTLVFILSGLFVISPAAGADGVGPTNYRSVIDSIDPPAPGVTVSIVGSDSFLKVRAEPGVRVQIPGYDGEPYLRIDADGSVFENRNSAAAYINSSRSGRVELPPELGASNQAEWKPWGDGGVVAWHDHRIHWMTDQVPDVAADGVVNTWEVPITVDGVESTIHGTLRHKGNLFPWPLLVTLAIVAVGALAVFRGRPRAVSPSLIGISSLAIATTLMVQFADPPGADRSRVQIALGIGALACAVAAIIPGRRPKSFRLAAVLGSAALLVGWLVGIIGAFWMPFVPAAVPAFGIQLMVGIIAGGVITSVLSILVDPISADT